MDREATYPNSIERAVSIMKNADRITAFTGAGISTESGISDFRSPGGVWDRYRIVTYQEFLESRESRMEYWAMKKELFSEIKDAQPNNAHKSLAELEKMGKLHCLITQNIDLLHQKAGSKNIIELHGSPLEHKCLSCGAKYSYEWISELVMADTVPYCEMCQGTIKPNIIFFGEMLDHQAIENAISAACHADLMLVLGSSLVVHPAASVPLYTVRNGGDLVIINDGETPLDNQAVLRYDDLETCFTAIASSI